MPGRRYCQQESSENLTCNAKCAQAEGIDEGAWARLAEDPAAPATADEDEAEAPAEEGDLWAEFQSREEQQAQRVRT
jgi:hypothetical protein